MKLHRCTAQSALAFALAATSASALATPIFSDDFNRALSNTVGNGWQEMEGAESEEPVYAYKDLTVLLR